MLVLPFKQDHLSEYIQLLLDSQNVADDGLFDA